MKTNSDTTRTLYLGLDVHKEKTVIAILEADRDAEPRDYGSVATSQHALERVIRRIAKAQGRELCELYVCYEARSEHTHRLTAAARCLWVDGCSHGEDPTRSGSGGCCAAAWSP
jgi:hypothetical protein